MAKAVKTIGVFTSGGDVPGMNVAIRAIVRTAINRGPGVKGIMHGYADLPEEEIVGMESTSASGIINRGGTILYMARCKESTTAKGQQKGVDTRRKYGIGRMVVIGGDGSFRGMGKPSALGISTIGLPGTIDLDIACTGYIIGFDTAVSTAMEVTDKIRDTSTSHERCGIVEVIGRNAGHIALWCGIGSSAEDTLLPERCDGNEQALINQIINNCRRGRKHNIITNVEGTGHSGSMAKRIEATTDIETGAIILGHTQCGGMLTREGKAYASIMGAKVAELLTAGKSNRLVAYKHGELMDFGIQETLDMTKDVPREQYEIARTLTR